MFIQRVEERAKFALIIESWVELPRFPDSGKIFVLLSPNTNKGLANSFSRGRNTPALHSRAHKLEDIHNGLLCRFPGLHCNSQQKAFVPLHRSPSCAGSSQLSCAERSKMHPTQSRSGTRQFPFHHWERIMKCCNGEMLVMLITCDNSIKWNDSQTLKQFRLWHQGIP